MGGFYPPGDAQYAPNCRGRQGHSEARNLLMEMGTLGVIKIKKQRTLVAAGLISLRSWVQDTEGNVSKDHGSGITSVESSMDDIFSAFGGATFEDVGSDHTNVAANQRNKLTMSRRTAPRDGEQSRAFNPRAPNFLQVEPGPDAEKVDLRHQEADDRKNAEEWMVDYALRRTVKKLARAQKRKVEMLVQAFETVLPPVPDEKNSE